MRIENVADLQVLIHAAAGGSLTAAAKVLELTPAAASAMLKRLEAQLGTRLFERSTRALRLTPEGQTLLKYAQGAFELLAEGEAQLSAEQAALKGSLRVTATVDLTRAVLLPWLSEFLELHPGLKLVLTANDRTLDLVRGEIDVALRYGKLADSSLVQTRLASPHLVACASPKYLARNPAPKQPVDLQRHNCLTFERGGRRNQTWRFARKGKWVEVRVDGDRSVDEATLAREWAVAGAGVVMLSSLNLRDDLARGRLVPLLSEWETEAHPLHAVMPSGKFVPQRVRAFIEFLTQKLASPTSATRPPRRTA